MTQILKFFSRHEPTDEVKNLIKKTVVALRLQPFYSSSIEEQFGHEYVRHEVDYSLLQDSEPFKDGLEILERVIGDYPERGDIVTLAGVFPAKILGEMVSKALSLDFRLNAITFEYERDRETNTVSRLKKAVVWQVSHGSLEILEVGV